VRYCPTRAYRFRALPASAGCGPDSRAPRLRQDSHRSEIARCSSRPHPARKSCKRISWSAPPTGFAIVSWLTYVIEPSNAAHLRRIQCVLLRCFFCVSLCRWRRCKTHTARASPNTINNTRLITSTQKYLRRLEKHGSFYSPEPARRCPDWSPTVPPHRNLFLMPYSHKGIFRRTMRALVKARGRTRPLAPGRTRARLRHQRCPHPRPPHRHLPAPTSTVYQWDEWAQQTIPVPMVIGP